MSTTPQQFGAKGDGLTDDTAALQRWVDAGGGEIPAGRFRFNGPLRYGPGFTITRWEGDLLYCRGWVSGYAFCSKDWKARTTGVRIDASARGRIIYTGFSDLPRKGFGLTYLDDFVLIRPTVLGGAAAKGINLFSAEVRGCRKGVIRGGELSVRSGQQGCDGIHFTDYNSDIVVQDLLTHAGDDGAGLTVEDLARVGAVMERISFIGCHLGTDGHSALKMLLLAIGGAAVLRDILLKNCSLSAQLEMGGAGTPLIALNQNRAGGARIEGLTIEGGSTTVIVPHGGAPAWNTMQFQGVDRLSLHKHQIDHFSRIAIDATDCPGMIVDRCPITPVAPVPAHPGVPVIQTINCPGAKIDTSLVKAGWVARPGLAEQALLA
jgi:hypothetical protein